MTSWVLQETAALINSKLELTETVHDSPSGDGECLMRKVQTADRWPALCNLSTFLTPPCLCFFTLKENGNNCSTSLRVIMGIYWMSIK